MRQRIILPGGIAMRQQGGKVPTMPLWFIAQVQRRPTRLKYTATRVTCARPGFRDTHEVHGTAPSA